MICTEKGLSRLAERKARMMAIGLSTAKFRDGTEYRAASGEIFASFVTWKGGRSC